LAFHSTPPLCGSSPFSSFLPDGDRSSGERDDGGVVLALRRSRSRFRHPIRLHALFVVCNIFIPQKATLPCRELRSARARATLLHVGSRWNWRNAEEHEEQEQEERTVTGLSLSRCSAQLTPLWESLASHLVVIADRGGEVLYTSVALDPPLLRHRGAQRGRLLSRARGVEVDVPEGDER
jgi:hypothetical protein